jgi:hypothetical protein
VLVRGHGAGWCSIIGGEFVTRAAGVPALTGRYLLGDFCHRGIESGRVAGSAIRAVRGTGLKVSSLSSFGKDGRGRVYAISNEGPVYRIVGR